MNLDAHDDEALIVIPANTSPSPETPARVVPLPGDPSTDLAAHGLEYLIEVYLLKMF